MSIRLSSGDVVGVLSFSETYIKAEEEFISTFLLADECYANTALKLKLWQHV